MRFRIADGNGEPLEAGRASSRAQENASRLTVRVNPVPLPSHNYLCIRALQTSPPSRRIPHTPTEVLGVPFPGFARRVLPLDGLSGDPP